MWSSPSSYGVGAASHNSKKSCSFYLKMHTLTCKGLLWLITSTLISVPCFIVYKARLSALLWWTLTPILRGIIPTVSREQKLLSCQMTCPKFCSWWLYWDLKPELAAPSTAFFTVLIPLICLTHWLTQNEGMHELAERREKRMYMREWKQY